MSAPALRLATFADLPRLRELIPASVRGLAPGYYTPQQIESSILHMFGPDSQLIADGTYFAVEVEGPPPAGWSRRTPCSAATRPRAWKTCCSTCAATRARIRAFFVHPASRVAASAAAHARCMDAARTAGFRRLTVATLPGVPVRELASPHWNASKTSPTAPLARRHHGARLMKKAHVEIEYCRRCRWRARAAWTAQELLGTFEEEMASVALVPNAEGGVFDVRVDGRTVFSRKAAGRFAEMAELKRALRDVVAPGRELGHVERSGD
jgi:selenoprotein W-related protein